MIGTIKSIEALETLHVCTTSARGMHRLEEVIKSISPVRIAAYGFGKMIKAFDEVAILRRLVLFSDTGRKDAKLRHVAKGSVVGHDLGFQDFDVLVGEVDADVVAFVAGDLADV